MKYVFQAVFSHSEGLDGDGTETHYTYYPATISDAAAGTMVTSVQASDALLSQSAPAGTSLNPFQLYYLHEYTTMQQFCSVQFFIFICLFFAPALGQLYVMMSPQEVLTGANQRSIAPRTQPYNA